MRYYIFSLAIFLSLCANAQENYSSLTKRALETMWEAKDEAGYKQALKLYEEAFRKYPDSIEALGLYKSAVLAAELNKKDQAFGYINQLLIVKTKEGEYPNWSSLLGETAKGEYKNIINDPRWEEVQIKATKEKNKFYNQLAIKEKEFFNSQSSDFDTIKNPKELYRAIKRLCPYQAKKSRDYSITFKINDTATTSYFIHLPKNYQPTKKYPLLFFLHGAVRHNLLSDYQTAHWLDGWNRYYTKYAELNDVILVFPEGSKEYNWMAPDDGFFMIPEILKQIKTAINIDDNKVFVTGHSNGATGSFSYLMKQPTLFAGFYGFNTYPKVFTGGTFIGNIKNRSFINFSTDQDYYYPPNANDSLTQLMKTLNADYKEYRYNGFPHWFPKFDESEPAYKILFDDLMKRQRNPFPHNLSWEFDDEKYGKIDWISDIKLDTLSANYLDTKPLNFKINQWLEYNKQDSLIVQKVDEMAFDFPRKSGKIQAEHQDNVFRILTTNIASFSIQISPEMVNLDKKIKVYVNGQLYFDKKVQYNREFMLENFKKNYDRTQVWGNSIKIKLSR